MDGALHTDFAKFQTMLGIDLSEKLLRVGIVIL